MTAFANVGRTDLLRREIDVYVGEEGPDGYKLIQPNGLRVFVKRDCGELVEPSFKLRENEARALLSALLKHFEGGDDTRQLRKDYEAERARVDRLLDRLPIVVER